MTFDQGFRAGLAFSAKKARETASAARSRNAAKFQGAAEAFDEPATVLDEAATPEPSADTTPLYEAKTQ